MKIIAFTLAMVFSQVGQLSAQSDLNLGVLMIRLENLAFAKGTVQMALYDSEESFMDVEKAKLYSFPVKNPDTLSCQIKDLRPGTYAIAFFHDEDDDGALNTNFFGIPQEPYGFSRQCPSKWRPPTFDEAKIEIKAGANQIVVPLQRWRL